MKRAITVAAALLMCASAAAAQDKVKKDKDRDKERPAAAQAAQPAPRPPRQTPPAQPAFTRPAQPQQPQPRFQPQPQQARPNRPARPDRPAVLDRPARPDAMAPRPRPDRPDRPVRPDRPATLDRPARPDAMTPRPRPDRPDRPVRPDRPATLDRPARPDAMTPRPRPDRPDRPTRPDRPDRPDRLTAPRPDRPVKADRPDRPARPARPDRPRPSTGAPKQRPPHSALPTKPNRVAKPNRPASPKAIAHSRQVRQAVRANRVKTYSYRGRTLKAVRARPYAYPANWRYRVWRRHQRFPVELFLASFFLNNYYSYGLSAPPPGYYWVRYGPDAVLVDRNSYDIADTAYGVFDDGSGYGQGYGDDANLPAIDEDLPQAFATGELDLAAGIDQSDACGFFYDDRQTQDDINQAWADQDWNSLAKTVIWAGCGNDISYYLLGLAAEGLVLPDAAGAYYGRAVELADGDVDSTFKCAVSGSDSCRGMDIGKEASDGMDRIYGPAN